MRVLRPRPNSPITPSAAITARAASARKMIKRVSTRVVYCTGFPEGARVATPEIAIEQPRASSAPPGGCKISRFGIDPVAG